MGFRKYFLKKFWNNLNPKKFLYTFHSASLQKLSCSSTMISGHKQETEIGYNTTNLYVNLRFPGGSEVKASACNAGHLGSIPGSGRSPREGNGNHSNILAWEIPWMQEHGGLQSTGSQRVVHNWATSLSVFRFHQIFSTQLGDFTFSIQISPDFQYTTE